MAADGAPAPRPAAALSVVLVAGDAAIAASVAGLIAAAGGLAAAGRATPRDAGAVIRRAAPDAVILADGPGAVGAMLAAAGDIPVVVISGGCDTAAGCVALRRGAADALALPALTAGALARSVAFAVERGRIRAAHQRRTRMLQVFSAAAGHDLSAPPRQISALCEMLMEELAPLGPPPGAARRVDQIASRADRLSRLLTDVLGFAAVGAASPVPVPVGLGAVLGRVTGDLDPADAARVVLERDGPLHADPALAELLIGNLVRNGLKYWRERPSRVRLRARPAGAVAEVTVTDDGIGFPVEAAETLFQPGRRGVSDDEFPGSGYGLAICAEIVALHGGSIAAAPARGGGTVMRVRLPLPAPGEPAT